MPSAETDVGSPARVLQSLMGCNWSAEVFQELDIHLKTELAQCCRGWPELAISMEAFLGHLARRLPVDQPPMSALSAIQMPDLYLCCACLLGDPSAVAAFERNLMPIAARSLRRLRLPAGLDDEVLQRVRTKLLVQSEVQPAGLAQFSGRGSLARWLRVVAVRTGLNALRDDLRLASAGDDALLDQIAHEVPDPEQVLDADRREAFRKALTAAFESLDDGDRTVLRLRVLDQLTLREIGAVHAVDASTISRRLGRIRESLLEHARGRLNAELGVQSAVLDSLVRALRGGLDLSIVRLLGDPES